MIARLIPMALAWLVVSCANAPLEAQHGRAAHAHGKQTTVAANPLTRTGTPAVLDSTNGYVGSYKGTLAITHISVGADGGLLASGTMTGGVAVNGVLTPANLTFADVPLTVSATTSSCALVEFQLSPASVGDYDFMFYPIDVWSSIAPKQFVRNACALAKGDRSVLPAINAAIAA